MKRLLVFALLCYLGEAKAGSQSTSFELQFDRQSADPVRVNQGATLGATHNTRGEVVLYEELDPYSRDRGIGRNGLAVGLLIVTSLAGKQTGCTAFAVSADHLVTAAHCLKPGSVREAVYLPSYYRPLATPHEIVDIDVVPVEYGPEAVGIGFDYAVVQPLHGKVPHFGQLELSAFEPSIGDPLELIHHPAAQFKIATRAKCYTRGYVDAGAILRHTCETDGASSGAPVILSGRNLVVAIHTGAVPGAPLNRALSIRSVIDKSPFFRKLGIQKQQTLTVGLLEDLPVSGAVSPVGITVGASREAMLSALRPIEGASGWQEEWRPAVIEYDQPGLGVRGKFQVLKTEVKRRNAIIPGEKRYISVLFRDDTVYAVHVHTQLGIPARKDAAKIWSRQLDVYKEYMAWCQEKTGAGTRSKSTETRTVRSDARGELRIKRVIATGLDREGSARISAVLETFTEYDRRTKSEVIVNIVPSIFIVRN